MARTRPRNPDEAALREFALALPETTEDFPWGHRAIKVRGKAFVFMGTGAEAGHDSDQFFLSCKLPQSAPMALSLEGVKPTGYGLGKSGWVSAEFPPGQAPVPMLLEWLEESYRAIAPKTLVAALDRGGDAAASLPAARKISARAKPRRAKTLGGGRAGKTHPRSGAAAPRIRDSSAAKSGTRARPSGKRSGKSGRSRR
jgi:predicted DNA-binding protein (MmcQ/YjbR family)